MKCIDDEIPFEIPASWEWTRLGNIAEIIGGYAFPSQTLKGNIGTRVIRISDISEDGFINARLVRYCGEPISDNYRIQECDILMAMTGGTVGKSLYVKSLPEEMFLNQRVAIIRNRYIAADFLNLVIKAPHIAAIINERKNSTNDNISMVDIYNFLIPIPCIFQQTQIVEKYYKVLALVNKYAKAHQHSKALNEGIKEKLRKSILQEAIQGRLVPQLEDEGTAHELLEEIKTEKKRLVKEGKLKMYVITDSTIFRGDDNKYYEQVGSTTTDITEQIPFDIPANWSWVRLAAAANLYTGNSISDTEKKARYTAVEGTEYIGTKDVGFDHKVNYSNGVNIPQQYLPYFKIAPRSSVLLCIEGGSAGRKVAIVDKDVCFGNKLCCLSPYTSTLSKYIFYYLQSPIFFEYFRGNLAGIIGGVSVNTLKTLIMPLPPQLELQRIVKHIDELFEHL